MSDKNEDDTKRHKVTKQTLTHLKSPLNQTGAHKKLPPPPTSQMPTAIPGAAPVPSMPPGYDVDKNDLARLWAIQNGVLVEVVDGNDRVKAAVVSMLNDNKLTRRVFYLVLLALVAGEYRDEMRQREKMASDQVVLAAIEAGRENVQEMRDSLSKAAEAMAAVVGVQAAEDELEALEEAEAAEAPPVPAWQARRMSSAEPPPPDPRRVALRKKRLQAALGVAEARKALAPAGEEKAARIIEARRVRAKLDAYPEVDHVE